MLLGYGPSMELRHLRYFITAAEELNVSRASTRLRVSQPAVSRQIHDLEEELGVPLFLRASTGLTLTPAGEDYLTRAREILRLSAEAAAHMKTYSSRSPNHLTVGCIAPALATILMPVLKTFSRAHPEIEVILHEMTPHDQVEALRSGGIDFALLGNPCPDLAAEFEVVILRHIPFHAVVPDDHPLAGRKHISLKQLKGETFIGFDENSYPGRNQSIVEACRHAGFTPRLGPRVRGLSTLLAQVAGGRGVTLAPEEVSRLSHPGAVFLPLKPASSLIASAGVYRKREKSPVLLDLVSLCQAGDGPP